MQDHPLYPKLQTLRAELVKIASADTAYSTEDWEARKEVCPLTSHCGSVSYVVQKLYGGSLMSGYVLNTHTGTEERHIWNVLPDGLQVDLTSTQYGGDGFNPLPGIEGKLLPKRSTTNWRFLRLWMRINAILES